MSEVYSVGLFASSDLVNPLAINAYIEGQDPKTRAFQLFYKGTAAAQDTYVIKILSAGDASFSDEGTISWGYRVFGDGYTLEASTNGACI